MRWTGFLSRPFSGQIPGASRLGRGVEALLILILAIQVARLIWVLAAPVGPFGEWRARQPAIPNEQARLALFASFDPFFPAGGTASGGVQQVTALPLQLYGIRINEGSGLGSAIIADESGAQKSYVVGEEISPGVTLKSVAYDHIVIARSGAPETLYINQSSGAGAGQAGNANGGPAAAPQPSAGGAKEPDAPLSSQAVLSDIGFEPRTEGDRVTGIVVRSQSSSDTFYRSGFRSGDIIVQLNGRPVTSMTDLRSLRDAIEPGARLSFMVERGAATVPVALIIPDKK